MTVVPRNWLLPGILPYNHNSAFRSRTVQWSGTDSLANLNKNKDRLQWDNIEILYNYNSHGFRSQEFLPFQGKPVNVALGCSFTEGVGLPAHMTWPSLIENKTGITTLNFGVGGGSGDTVAMILSNISEFFNIQTAYILWPRLERFDFYAGNNIDSVTANTVKKHEECLVMDEHAIPRFQKNQKIAHLLSKLHSFNIKELAVTNPFLEGLIIYPDDPVPRARDGLHDGPKQHIGLTERFLNS
jgi:hypothetical protein